MKDFFFAQCSDLGSDAIHGSWKSLADLCSIYSDVVGLHDGHRSEHANYRHFSQLVVDARGLYNGRWSEAAHLCGDYIGSLHHTHKLASNTLALYNEYVSLKGSHK